MVRLLCAGESDSLVALLQRSTSAAQRMQVLECLQRETPDTRAKLAGDALCLGALEEWVLDLTEDRMSFHVLETLLKVRLPDAVWLQICLVKLVCSEACQLLGPVAITHSCCCLCVT